MLKRVMLYAPLLIILLTCACSLPFIAVKTVAPGTTVPTDRVLANGIPLATATGLPGFTVVSLHPQGGDLMAQISREVQKAAELGQQPVVEFDASW